MRTLQHRMKQNSDSPKNELKLTSFDAPQIAYGNPSNQALKATRHAVLYDLVPSKLAH